MLQKPLADYYILHSSLIGTTRYPHQMLQTKTQQALMYMWANCPLTALLLKEYNNYCKNFDYTAQ